MNNKDIQYDIPCRMAYASRLYPRAEPRGFTLQWIKPTYNFVLWLAQENIKNRVVGVI